MEKIGMLVLTRGEGEVVVIGDDRTVMTQLSPLDEQALRNCADVRLRPLADRLLATLGHPVQIAHLGSRQREVRIGFHVPKELPVDRLEIYEAKRSDPLSGPRKPAA